jgi:transcriptional regulator with XRE-family HTH domain
MIDQTYLGQRIFQARARSGLSQKELAESVGVSDKTVSAYEVGRVEPPLHVLAKISEATEHPFGYFLGDIESTIETRLQKITEELDEIRDLLSKKQSE